MLQVPIASAMDGDDTLVEAELGSSQPDASQQYDTIAAASIKSPDEEEKEQEKENENEKVKVGIAPPPCPAPSKGRLETIASGPKSPKASGGNASPIASEISSDFDSGVLFLGTPKSVTAVSTPSPTKSLKVSVGYEIAGPLEISSEETRKVETIAAVANGMPLENSSDFDFRVLSFAKLDEPTSGSKVEPLLPAPAPGWTLQQAVKKVINVNRMGLDARARARFLAGWPTSSPASESASAPTRSGEDEPPGCCTALLTTQLGYSKLVSGNPLLVSPNLVTSN